MQKLLKTNRRTKRGQKQLFLGVDKFCISLKLWSLHMHHSLYPYMIYDISKQHREYFPPFVGCLIHPELVKLTYIHMGEEQRADVHPFLVIELVTTYMYMDEEHRADFHPFLVILCALYLFVAQYTLSWLHLSLRASAPTAIVSSSTG